MFEILVPLFAVLGQTGGVLIDKVTLAIRKVRLNFFIAILFVFLCLLTAPLLPFFGKVDWGQAFSSRYLIYFVAMLIVAIIWNVYYYRGFQYEKLYEFELIIMTTPLITVLLAGIFLPAERNIHIIIVTIIASLAVIFAKIRAHHLYFSKYSIGLVIAVILMSIETIFIKKLLTVYSPASLYFYRTFVIAIFFLIFLKPKLKGEKLSNWFLIIASAATGVLQMVLKFWGFRDLGVIYTTLVLTLAPVLIYISSAYIFHENMKKRSIIAAAIIVGCIVYATMLIKK